MIHSKRLVEQDVLFIKLTVTVPSQQTSSFASVKPRYRSAFVSPFSVFLADCRTQN